MALVYWYKDKKTKAPVYYDTDDLNDEQYSRVLEIYKQLENLHPFSKEAQDLYDEKNRIIRIAISGGNK